MASYVAALLGASSANGFQLVTSGAQAKAMSDFQIVNIQVRTNLEMKYNMVHFIILSRFHAHCARFDRV